jgi:hypothetical protein
MPKREMRGQSYYLDGKETTREKWMAAAPAQTPKVGYSGSFLPDPLTDEACDDCPSLPPHKRNSPEHKSLWAPGERKAYDGMSGDGVHTFAELIEMDDEMKHAYD